MGQMLAALKRPIRSFNIENRAHKVISKAKPTPAPQYPETHKQREIVDQLDPTLKNRLLKKDSLLDERLKRVFVLSKDPEIEPVETVKRPLPQNRQAPDALEYGVYEPPIVPEGKCTLSQALKFIAAHKSDPEEYSTDKIAQEYKIDEEQIKQIIKYYKLVKVVDPKDIYPQKNKQIFE